MFGLDLGSDKLLASLGPPGMTKRMSKELFDYPTDLLSLPGAWSTLGADEEDYETQQTFSQLSDFLRTTPGSKHRGHDPGWKNKSHHALGKVKTMEALNMLAEEYLATKNRSLTYEASRLKEWMQLHHYSSKEVEEFQQTGGLPLVMRALTNLYEEMLTTMRTTALKHGTIWEGSYAQAMLEYHKKELGHIRGMAGTRKDFLLTTYVYLRNASKSKWTNQEIQSTMCVELNAALQSLPTNWKQGGEAAGDRRKGCRCQNQALHTLLQLSFFDVAANLCPVAAAPNSQKARTAAKLLKVKVEGHIRQHGGPPTKATWQPWAAKAVEAAAAGQTSI
jgi:hypothetical protein